MSKLVKLQLKDYFILGLIVISVVFSAYFYLGNMEETKTEEYTEVVEKSDNGLIIKISQVDKEGNLVENKQGYFYSKKEINKEEHKTITTYYDANGNAVNTKRGFAKMVYLFDDEDKLLYCFCYDENDKYAILENGQSGYSYKSDEKNRRIEVSFINEKKEIINGTCGYATSKRVFNDDDSLKTEMFYDTEGKPAKTFDGAYGVGYEGDKSFYLDINGKPLLCIRNIVEKFPFAIAILGILICLFIFVFRKKQIALGIFLGVYVLFVAYITLFRQQTSTSILEPFSTYKRFLTSRAMRVEILNNVWLFVPIGVTVRLLFHKKWIIVLPIVFSVLIEVMQLVFGLGSFEFDDMISNSIGTILGFGIAYMIEKIDTDKHYTNHPDTFFEVVE